jgi:uncharacterized protein
MDFSGQQTIPAPRALVWQKLNDMALLRECITGCESITPMEGEADAYDVAVTAAVGPVKAKFKGKMRLTDKIENEGYTLAGEGNGGMAGFGKMGATVKLADAEGGTLLTYDAKATVGGKLAQIGARLIQATTNKFADDFFSKFNEKVAADVGGSAAPASSAPAEDAHGKGVSNTNAANAASIGQTEASAPAPGVTAASSSAAPASMPAQHATPAPQGGWAGFVAWLKKLFG